MQPPVAIATQGSQTLAAADLRGVGKFDLIVPVSGDNITCEGFLVLLGNGDGTFEPPICNYDLQAENNQAITIADINGDGKLDVVMEGNGISVSLGNGDGTFQPPLLYPVPHIAGTMGPDNSVAAGDLNGDGSLDLAALSTSASDASYVTTFLSNPVAVFSASKLNFGKVASGKKASRNLTITNQSPTHLSIAGGLTITGSGASDYSQTNTCGSGLPAYGSCTVTVVFTASGTGLERAALNVPDSAAGKTRTITLTGTVE